MIEIVPSQMYTIRDLAEYFKCSTRKVHRLIASGQLQGFKIGNQRRFKGEEVLQFIERRDNGLAAPAVPVAPGTAAVAASAPAAPVTSGPVQLERLYSLREVSALLDITVGDAISLFRQGRLPGFRVGMDWRCWGRDLLKLAQQMNLSLEADATQVASSTLGP